MRRRLWVAGVLLAAAIAGIAAFALRTPSPAQRLTQARILFKNRESAAAEQIALSAASEDPSLIEAVLLASDAAVAQGEFSRAAEHLLTGVGHPTEGPEIRLRRARLLRYRLFRFDEAETELTHLLEIVPDHLDALEELARLLGLCGRRQAAVPFVLRMIRGGRVNDLIILLARPDGRLNDPEALRAARAASPHDRNAALGDAARLLSDANPGEALTLLREVTREHPSFVPAQALLGEALMVRGTLEERQAWETRTTSDALAFPEVWRALSEQAQLRGDMRTAVRCCWEAIRRQPESRSTLYRLMTLLSKEQPSAEGAETPGSLYLSRLRERFEAQQALEEVQGRLISGGQDATSESALELARLYGRVGRNWESLAWRIVAASASPLPRDDAEQLALLRKELPHWPLDLTTAAENPANWFDVSSYPLPNFKSTEGPEAVAPSIVPANAPSASSVQFRDDAAGAGLKFRYINGTDGPPSQRMYEFTGGGIGVLDFDRDGFQDLCLAQGHLWGLSAEVARGSDGLFRNEGARTFSNVAQIAQLHGEGFGQGVGAGDLNNDGFPDIGIARIGKNELWLNNGDGTFEPVPGPETEMDSWTTSCMLADVNGDGLPDRYDVNYVQGSDVFERVCRQIDGHPGMCMPFDFEGASDRLWINNGDGTWTAHAGTIDDPPGKGLGILAWDARGTGNVDLLIANDTTPNRLLIGADFGKDTFRLQDTASAAGIALNAEGKATGSMGIALADLTGDGYSDIQITNFLGEPSTLFVGLPEGLFEDRSKSVGLAEPTAATLGFGTQFLDADLDGRQELFLANGHIDDLERLSRPYRQSPQLFRFDERGGVSILAPATAPSEPGEYFRKKWLGRSVVRLDWNRDGLPDLVVGHLGDPYSLLTNETSAPGHGLTLSLVGTRQSRDAIGARVRTTVSGKTQTAFVSAGDGYEASNERTIILGFGSAARIDRLTVYWPGGERQEFSDIALPASAILVERGPLLFGRAVEDQRR